MKDSTQIRQLEEKIELMQLKLDSITKLNEINQLEYELVKKQEIIGQINSFYDSAWLKLLVVITILGVIIPIVIQYFQRKNFTDLIDSTTRQLRTDFETKLSQFDIENKSQIKKVIEDIETKFRTIEEKNKHIISEADGILFYLQGSDAHHRKDFLWASLDYFRSSYCLLNTDKMKRLEISFSNIEISLKNLKSQNELDVKKLNDLIVKYFEIDLDTLLDQFQSHKNFRIYKKHYISILKLIEENRNDG